MNMNVINTLLSTCVLLKKNQNDLYKTINKLEKRIAALESKPPKISSDRHPIDFKCEVYTKVPDGENESDTERLKGRL